MDAALARDGAPTLLTKTLAAKLLAVCPRTVDRRRAAGLLAGRRVGGRTLFMRRALAAHVIGGGE